MTEKFKPFWVVSVNSFLCDAGYNGKQLKADHPVPSFREFTFIRSMEELKYFRTRKEISNQDLVTQCLNRTKSSTDVSTN